MRVFALTKLGEQVAVKTKGTGVELEMLRYMYRNKSQPVSEDELNNLTNDARFILSKLRKHGLITELTSG
jgi:hypothetical protein